MAFGLSSAGVYGRKCGRRLKDSVGRKKEEKVPLYTYPLSFTYSHSSLAMLEAKLLIIFRKGKCLSWFWDWNCFERSDKR